MLVCYGTGSHAVYCILLNNCLHACLGLTLYRTYLLVLVIFLSLKISMQNVELLYCVCLFTSYYNAQKICLSICLSVSPL